MPATYFITNPEKTNKSLLSSSDIICLCPKDFLDISIEENDSIVVLCEIDIDSDDNPKNRTDFYGVKFVQELRRSRYKNKILFVSFCDRYFHSNIAKHTIINTIGHDFLRMPKDPNEYILALKNIDNLTDEGLMVCKHSFCSNHGLIDYLTHSLKSKSEATDNYFDYLNKVLIDICSLYNSEIPKDFSKKFSVLDKENLSEAITFIKNQGEIIKSENPETDSKNEILTKPLFKYEILWLDDEACENDLLYTTLTNHVLNLKVHLVNTVDKAISILEKDNQKRPKIMLVIVDYVLLEGDKSIKVQQKKQGYQLIKFIANQGYPIKVLVLSSMQRTLQNWLAELYGISIKSIQKQAINIELKSGVNYVIEEALKLANDNWLKLSSLPNSKAWEKNLKATYSQIISHPNYEEIEKRISEGADKWITSFQNGFLPKKLNISRNGDYTMIKGVPLLKEKELYHINKHIFEAFQSFSIHPDDFIDSLSKKEIKLIQKSSNLIDIAFKRLTKDISDINEAKRIDFIDENIEHSIPYFVGRRVSYFLTKVGYNKQVDNARIMSGDEGMSTYTAKQYHRSAAIHISNTYKHLTIEEKLWCQNNQYQYFIGDNGLNIETNHKKEQQIIKQFLRQAESYINNFINEVDFEFDSTTYSVDYAKNSIEFLIKDSQFISIELNNIRAFLIYISKNYFDFREYSKSTESGQIAIFRNKIAITATLIRTLINKIEGYEIHELKALTTFLCNLCTEEEKKHQKSKKDLSRECSNSTKYRLDEFYSYPVYKKNHYTILDINRNLNEPWILLKRKGKLYTEKEVEELKSNCVKAIYSQNPSSYFSDFKSVNIKRNENEDDKKYYFEEYYYINEVYNQTKHNLSFLDKESLENYAILWGKIRWKQEMFEFNSENKKFSNNSKKSKDIENLNNKDSNKVHQKSDQNIEVQNEFSNKNLLEEILRESEQDLLLKDKIFVDLSYAEDLPDQ